jgi:hypothetical protein
MGKHHQGKVVSLLFKDTRRKLTKGQPLVFKMEDGSLFHVIYQYSNMSGWYYSHPSDKTKYHHSAGSLDLLQGRYLAIECSDPIDNEDTYEFDLKWSQWAEAIKNGEVDSDKEVQFEIKWMDRPGKYSNSQTDWDDKGIARIIPQKSNEPKRISSDTATVNMLKDYVHKDKLRSLWKHLNDMREVTKKSLTGQNPLVVHTKTLLNNTLVGVQDELNKLIS